MENNGMFSNTLGLEMSLTHHHQTPNFLHQQPPYAAAVKPATDEETNNPATTDDSGGDGKLRKGSPWQRMKWTDNMVRLLIMVVFYVGDEAGSEQPPAGDTAARKKGGGGGGGGGVMQKKGKWKSVSLAMMERGFYVSPQQCEDKFNDLNKRYKRVNDILGKGTACKVVENQSLLESMDHIPVKLKEEVKKLLNSKHLFFREMCAYHNSCGGGSGGGGGGGGGGVGHHPSPPEVGTVERQHSHHRPNCVHSNEDEDEEEDDEGDDENEEDGDREEEEDDGLSTRKRARAMENGDVIRQFSGELSSVVQDLTKSVWEKRQWMKVRMMQLEEQRVGFQGESYELEKRRSKWLKFSYSKEREMEIEKLKNERMKLENERMVLLLRQKEMELVDHQQQQYSSNVHKRTSDPSSING
ncbi:putative transcription factor Trihelix family [Helianthus annuus]|uniref:Putative sequence-specific DNA binding transcription factor n=1 Tax=Helianthus annuus TaxID=4232 RepID=A0A251TFA5_HELAN|nr:kinesin-related protein 4 [Helianthus annuus]KAF5784120.1 putative transcription factor Trihelix family [Helianthus annuus]KAJ0503359.1 putative transcription factor Trihelix family [Helianthus annuus]KAJ0519312.1 putative transcription factor Trihelix family [Helianthus annuus]KAJ0691109.1 putative transcription factor Trihelix family [Helianthus annuus]